MDGAFAINPAQFIAREEQIKSWTRAKRLALIATKNLTWQDLAEGWGEKVELQIPRRRMSLATDPSLLGMTKKSDLRSSMPLSSGEAQPRPGLINRADFVIHPARI